MNSGLSDLMMTSVQCEYQSFMFCINQTTYSFLPSVASSRTFGEGPCQTNFGNPNRIISQISFIQVITESFKEVLCFETRLPFVVATFILPQDIVYIHISADPIPGSLNDPSNIEQEYGSSGVSHNHFCLKIIVPFVSFKSKQAKWCTRGYVSL